MTRFLHTADWQIGAQFGQFEPAEASILADARFEVVRLIGVRAALRAVDAVLVAGDVFDQQTVSDTVIRRLFGALVPYQGPWYFIPGNHDAAIAESVWTRAVRLGCVPENAHLILTPGVVNVDALKLSLLCAPLTQRNTYDDTTEFFDRAESPEGYLRVGLAHGSVAGQLAESIDSANPIAPTRSRSARLDYLALGDWHGTFSVDERTWYAGTPEQDRFKANEPGNVLEVALAGPGATPEVRVVRIGRYRWHRWDHVISVSSDVDQLVTRLASLGENDVLKLNVSGSADLTRAQEVERTIAVARARVRALRSDTTDLQILPSDEELEALGGQGGYVGTVVGRLREMQADDTRRQVASEALMLLAKFKQDSKGGA